MKTLILILAVVLSTTKLTTASEKTPRTCSPTPLYRYTHGNSLIRMIPPREQIYVIRRTSKRLRIRYKRSYGYIQGELLYGKHLDNEAFIRSIDSLSREDKILLIKDRERNKQKYRGLTNLGMLILLGSAASVLGMSVQAPNRDLREITDRIGRQDWRDGHG
jgi:hypothetical protein